MLTFGHVGVIYTFMAICLCLNLYVFYYHDEQEFSTTAVTLNGKNVSEASPKNVTIVLFLDSTLTTSRRGVLKLNRLLKSNLLRKQLVFASENNFTRLHGKERSGQIKLPS